MQTGIIGLPQVGKTSLFRILTRAKVDTRSAPAQMHLGIARVPDARVAKLAEAFKPKKVTYATIEYVDIGGLQKDREKNSASLVPLREADALAHVVRLFENPSVPHEGGSLDALRDIESVEIELMLYDLEQATKRIERVEKDLKKKKETILETELALLNRCRAGPGIRKAFARTRIQAGRNQNAYRLHVSHAQAHALRLEPRRRRSGGHRSRCREISSREAGRETAHRRGSVLRKNRSGAGRTRRRRSGGDDESIRPRRIRPRSLDSGELPFAGAAFVSYFAESRKFARGRSSAA